MKKSPILILSLLVIIVVLANLVYFSTYKTPEKNQTISEIQTSNQTIKPSQFTTKITNSFFTLTPGNKMLYRSQTKDGLERSEVYVLNETKLISGIRTQAVWKRVWLNNELIEDTKNYYAQDKEESVWIFGEDIKKISNGQVVSTEGSWQAGIDGAEPGIIMKATPVVGESYKHNLSKEESIKIIAILEKVTVPFGTYVDCVKTLETKSEENKFYCSEVGFVALEVNLESGEKNQLERVELNSQPSPTLSPELRALGAKISEDQAKEIALKRVPGEIIDLTLEEKFNKNCYVVKISSSASVESKVFIDITSGKVINIEP